MADASTTDPADQDPISQTTTAMNALNFKTFVDNSIQYSHLALGNAISNQQTMSQFSQALLARCTDMILDKSANATVDAVLDQASAKVVQTIPPVYSDPSSSLAALAAQMSTVVQLLQGLNIAPSAAVKA